MRNNTSFASTLIVTLALAGLLTAAAPAEAQTDRALAVGYNWLNQPTPLHGFAADYSEVTYGDWFTTTINGTYVQGGGSSYFFTGIGPGVRWPMGGMSGFANALFGYRHRGRGWYDSTGRDASGSGFGTRFTAGIEVPTGSRYRFRGAVASGQGFNVTTGVTVAF